MDNDRRKEKQVEIPEGFLHDLINSAAKDELTGLFNRKGFFEFAQQEIAYLLKQGSEFSILMLDIDYFKNVNDSYGHDEGDIVLRQVAGLLRDQERD